MVALARIHAPVFGDLALAATDWLNQPTPLNQALLTALLPGFLERYQGRIAPEHVDVCERFVAAADAWDADRRPPLGLVHGDYRLDNMLFHDGTCTVVDWQTLGFGPAMRDAAYFLGSALPVDERRAHEESLVRAYHDELLAHGVAGFDWEQCWEEYRRQCFLLLVMTIAPAMVVERTDRGDDMFMAVLGRAAQMAIDLNATELLPEPDAGANAPLRPDPADEGTTSPVPRSSGTRAGTSTRSATTDGWASTTGSGGCPTRTPASSRPASSAPASRRSCWSIRARPCRRPTTRPRRSQRRRSGRATAASSRCSGSGWSSRARRPLTPITRHRFARKAASR